MAYTDVPGIRDVAGAQKNPAIEEKQDTANTALSAIQTAQTDGMQKTQIVDESNPTIGTAVRSTGSDAISNATNTLVSSAFAHGFNGTAWDRLRSSTANGLEVDVRNQELPTLEETLKVKIDLTKKWKDVTTIAGAIKTQYVATADVGTATSAASWTVVRIIKNLSTAETQIEGRTPMSWDNRADPTLDSLVAWEAI